MVALLTAVEKAPWAPERGDMIWINYSPGSAKEMLDEHPMLVLTPRIFSERTGIVIGLPMSTSDRNEDNPFAVRYTHAGVTGYVLTHLPKSFDWRARGARPHHWGKAPRNVMEAATDGFKELLAL